MLDVIYPIVEGHGEVKAVPPLLRRFATEVYQNFSLEVLSPYRLSKGQMLGDGLPKLIAFAARKLRTHGGNGAILLITDADDDLPCQIGPILHETMVGAAQGFPCAAVIATREFEAWFLAAAKSLRNRHGIRPDAIAPPSPETVRGAKEYLEKHILVDGRSYSPTIDQPALVAAFSFEEARQCSSFDKLWRDLDRLFAA